jgi:hypothetical protein
MEIEVHQRGGILGLDRSYLVKDGVIEVTDNGHPSASVELDPAQDAHIRELAESAEMAQELAGGAQPLVSDSMETDVSIRGNGGTSSLTVRTGDDRVPPEVWQLIGEVSRASGV